MERKPEEDEVGKDLRENNEKIVHCLLELKAQRDDLIYLMKKQNEERIRMEMEMERLTYKLCLISKSMSQRLKAKQNYDQTIADIEENYNRLRENSENLMSSVTKNCNQLDNMINKKTSTEDIEPHKSMSEDTFVDTKDEECACVANKDGKCIREKMLSKMTQAYEADVPTKLEKPVKYTDEKEAGKGIASNKEASTRQSQ